VPAHVRDDPHLSLEFWRLRIPINPDSFEDWVASLRESSRAEFDRLLDARLPRPPASIFRPTGDERAPVPIAGVIDTQQLRLTGLVRGVFDPRDVGLAEFTNPNYLSLDTVFKDFALPRPNQLGAPFLELEEGKVRRYWPKLAADGVVEVQHFVAEGVLYAPLADATPDPPPAGWVLNSRVSGDYAADLLPRAVAHAASLIDYFFRGRLDVDVLDNRDAGEPSQLRIAGTNGSEEPLLGGTLTLLAEDAHGVRTRLDPASGVMDDLLIGAVGPGGELASTWFSAPAPAERFVAVFQGSLGDEPPVPAPGAVVGTVLGGVRVEHVVADGNQWKIRTPTGVFPLPLTTVDYEEVKWGGGTDVLAARTGFGPGMPNRFASFAVLRREGSIELATDPISGLVILGELAAAEFPFGVPLTTVTFNQTIHYRQRLARADPVFLYYRWTGRGSDYFVERVDAAAPVLAEVSRKDFTFADTFAIAFDQAHNLQFNPFGAERYVWDVFSFTADATGRLFAVINVELFAPAQMQTTDFLGINHVTGELEKQSTAFVEAFMPVDVGTVWALLDLGNSLIVASTVGETIAVVSEANAEAPPFAHPSYVRLDRFEPIYTAGIWLKPISIYEDGPLGGFVGEQPWGVVAPVDFSSELGVLAIRAVVESSVGVDTVTASGLRRGDLAAAVPISTAITSVPNARDMYYMETGPGELEGIRVETTDRILPAPARLFDVRPVASAGAPTLALLALDSEAGGGATHVIAWDHAAGHAVVAATLAPGAHGLTGATPATALVNSFMGPQFDPAGFLVPLNEPRPPLAFPDEDLWSFTVLEPNYLLNTENAKFYRLRAPLQRTALPAALAGSAGPSGDFHAVRLP
jgi:hypothetical protein